MRLSLILFLCLSANAQWRAYNRRGAIFHNEQACYSPSLAVVTASSITLNTISQSAICGVFDSNGWTWNPLTSYPYQTSGVQWDTFKFLYGTLTINAAFPPQSSNTWPALWLQGEECRLPNLYEQDFGNGCPISGAWQNPDYLEIDIVECGGLAPWCRSAVYAGGGVDPGGNAACTWSLTDTDMHAWQMVWTPTSLVFSKDGAAVCSISSPIPARPMFLIMQTQVIGNNAVLPASLIVQSVEVKDQTGAVIFSTP